MLRGQQAFGAFENLLGRALALSSEGKENQARALLIANQATIDATTKALLAHREFKAQTGRERAEEAVLALARATQLSILVACAAIVFVVYKGLTMVRYISRSLKRVVRIAVDIGDGNLCHDFGVAAKDEIGELMTALEQMNGALVRIVSEVRAGTASVASATEEIACGNEHLSARTEQQAGALEETASTMEQLTATVQQNAGNAEQAEQLASSALKYASEGGVTVELVVQTMMAIDATSRKIADITAVVDSLAFQTNILALNAAVEAARAGEQGRGFAVVAGEVRTLAHRAACAASEIKVLIGKSVSEVQAGGRLVIDAGAGMKQVVDSVRSVSAVVAAITLASKEQSAGIGQINTAIIQIDGTTQQNAALVVQASAAAASLRDQASSLYDTVSLFKTS
ncbi:MAG: methyl-accepting chemotaxis protein [Sphingomonadaceae bacterium]